MSNSRIFCIAWVFAVWCFLMLVNPDDIRDSIDPGLAALGIPAVFAALIVAVFGDRK